MRLLVFALVFTVFAGSCLYAQYMISAHSGVVHYVEGKAYINDTLVEPKFGKFLEIKENQELRTGEGRAEVLLTPGVFLRMSENSSIRMLSTRLTDTRVEILTGSVMVECDDAPKDNAVTLLYKGTSMLLVKHGLYRLDANQTRFQVYDGESIVKSETGPLTLKSGKRTALAGALIAENFDKRQGDELYIWSSQRSSYLAKANVASAMALRDSGNYSGTSGSWSWNPMFGMFAFVPASGTLYSSFGGGFWSPYTVGDYNSGYYYGGGRSSYSKGMSSYTPSGSQVGYASGAGRASGGGYSAPSTGGMGSGVHTGGGGVGRGAGAGRGR
jgi:hypothetical protein